MLKFDVYLFQDLRQLPIALTLTVPPLLVLVDFSNANPMRRVFGIQ